MAKKIKQYLIEKNNYTTGQNILANGEKVIELGIQAEPGTTFKLNNGGAMTINKSGIFELSTHNNFYITDIRFEALNGSQVLVDIIYQEGLV